MKKNIKTPRSKKKMKANNKLKKKANMTKNKLTKMTKQEAHKNQANKQTKYHQNIYVFLLAHWALVCLGGWLLYQGTFYW